MSFPICGRCQRDHNPYQACADLAGPKVFSEPTKDHQELTEILTVATAPRLSNAERQRKWKAAHKAQVTAYQKDYMAKRRA